MRNNFSLIKCVFCNYEIRERNVSETLQKFCIELSESQNESEKASYIRNYPIPNSKEDILEFMILASSNINGESNITVFEAWSAKLEQAYQKAKMVFQSKEITNGIFFIMMLMVNNLAELTIQCFMR